MQICPSMPMPDIQSLAQNLNKLAIYYKYFQIDIGDGIFVKNRTLQIEEIENNINLIKNYQDLIFDFHLMVADFEKDILKLNRLSKIINIKNIFIHHAPIKENGLYSHFDFNPINQTKATIGLTIDPQDQINDLASLYDLKNIRAIQIMSVTPGVQGNPFLPETLNKIEQLRLLGYRNKIFLDGAVNDKTILVIDSLKFKPDVICPGSYLTKADADLPEKVKFLKKFTS